MNKKLSKMICTALAVGFVAAPGVYAEEAAEFSLDKVVVTALRAETKELDTPASVTVKTGEELKATGATTVIDALQFVEGINIYSQNPYGQSAGRMSSELVIRGAKKGTLIMVNGAPINMNGNVQLDNILLENVEKVEVVRGAGSVMYGSDAFGGVINIITKKQVNNSFTTSAGTNGKQNHSLNLQTGKLAFSTSFSKLGDADKITDSPGSSMMGVPANWSNFIGGEKRSLTTTYRFDDKLTFNYTHLEDEMDKETRRKSDNTLYQLYNDKENLDRVGFNYVDGDWKANLYGSFRELDYYTKNTNGTYASKVNLKSNKYGVDTNKIWQDGSRQYLVGLTLDKETYDQITFYPTAVPKGNYDRSAVSLYTQLTQDFSSSQKLIVGLRGQTSEDENGKTYEQLLPQFQYNQRVGEDSSWFVNAGKAFRLPTFTELYAPFTTQNRFYSNSALKPESGWTYETGWKKHTETGLLKLTLFAMDFKDHIDTDPGSKFQNFKNFKNEGFEASFEQKLSDKYSYIVGGSYSNPRQQLNSTANWTRTYSRIQSNLVLRYTQDRITANLSANYIADRANDAPNAFPVNLMLNYQATPDTLIFTTVRNIFDRHDVTTNNTPNTMSGYFYGMPRTFEIGVKHSF